MKIGTNFARKTIRGGMDMNHLEKNRIQSAILLQKILNLPMPERERKDNWKNYQEFKIRKANRHRSLNKRIA